MCQPNAMLFIEFGDTRLTFALIVANIPRWVLCKLFRPLPNLKKPFSTMQCHLSNRMVQSHSTFRREKSAVAINKCKTAKGSFNRKKVLTRSPKQHRMPVRGRVLDAYTKCPIGVSAPPLIYRNRLKFQNLGLWRHQKSQRKKNGGHIFFWPSFRKLFKHSIYVSYFIVGILGARECMFLTTCYLSVSHEISQKTGYHDF